MMGVYEICNLHDGKATAYVGSSVDIEKRWSSHRSRLRCGAHPNIHLQRAWDACGGDAFEWRIIEELEDGCDLLAREQYWLDRYLENPCTCYNFARDTQSPFRGRNHSNETKCKMSAAAQGNQRALGYKHTDETRRKMGVGHAGPYPAFIHRETGKIILAGMNLRKLCRECGLEPTNMRRMITGRYKSSKGWTLLEERSK